MNQYFYRFKNRTHIFLIIVLFLTGMFYIGYRFAAQFRQPAPEIELPQSKPVFIPKPSDQYLTSDTLLDIKLARDRERSREAERVQGVLDKIGLSDDVRKQAEQELWRLTQASSKEIELENLLKVNGFKDCMVSISHKLVTVVVSKNLLPEQVRLIGQLTTEVTGLGLDQIQIVERP